MYEFPTSFRISATFEEIIFTFLVLIPWSGTIYWIHKRHLFFKQFSLTLFSAMAILATCLISLITFPPPEFQYQHRSPFYNFSIIYVWLVSACGALINLHRLSDNEDTNLVAKSFRELLVIGFACLSFIVVAVILPAPFTSRLTANRRTSCLNNMRNLGLAVQIYATDKRGDIPATEGGEPPRSWRVEILPHIEQQSLREKYNDELAWNEGENAEIARTEIEVYKCPANPIQQTPEGYRLTGYAAVTGTNAMWAKQKSLSLDNVSKGDGLSQTFMIVEACGQNIAWSEPRDVDLDILPVGINLPGEKRGESNGILSSYHGYGANVIFADGSGRLLSEKTDPRVLKALSTATSGEVLTADDY